MERHLDWRAVNSTGAAGGILVFWDNRVVELVELEEGEFSILVPVQKLCGWIGVGIH